jgi:putative endonuclease
VAGPRSPDGPKPLTARAALGKRAEAAVSDYLGSVGIEVLDANVRVGRFEIDLLARDGEVIVVVEVRTRGTGAWVRAFDSIDWRKRKRIRFAGERLWRDRFARRKDVERMRFDCASVTFDADGTAHVEYVRAAF